MESDHVSKFSLCTKKERDWYNMKDVKDVLKAIVPIILLCAGASIGLAWIIGQVKP